MSAVLTDNLPLLAGAPNGIKKLRELILDLAVRGKLVPQDANDEPASELLKRIAEEKARLVAEGKIKKQKPLAEIGEEERPFELPEQWAWVRLADLAYPQAGFAFKSGGFNTSGLGLPLIRIRDVGQSFSGTFYEGEYRSEFVVESSDYLISMDGQFRVATWQGDSALLNQRVSRLIFFGTESARRFIADSLQARLLELQGVKAYTTVDHLSGGQISEAVIAMPPIAEQHRIVAKVDELMALCDRLEARQADADSAHAQLMQALLGSLTQASDVADFAQSWQRLAEYFHTLFTTESSIDALKQTLLQLAVMGKLVAQDPSDEPASELLKRIAEEKERLISEEGLRTTARDDVPEAEHYFMLHTGWASCRLGNLARFIDYRGRTPTKTSSGVPLITAKNVRPGFVSRDPQEFIADTDYLSWMTRGFPRVGDMLFTTEAPMGNVAIIDITERFALAQRVICFQLHELETGPFLKLALMSSGFQAQLSDAATGMTATGIKSSRLKEIPVPIPPLAEQHRIVAKVDELMALCDQLKARLNQARQVHEYLASALVEQAVA